MAEILRLYSEIYPNSDKTEPPEMFQITSIPTAVSFSDGPALGASAGRIREYEAYHERVVKTQFGSQVRGSLPPPPPGYVEWSFRKYPVQGRDQAPGYNIPTRTTPQYNPLNEFNSEELLALHSDRDLQKEMERAWARIRNEELSQERSSKRSEETRRAFQLLWEVFLLRRYWTGPLKADQTTRWFVQERNRLRV
ncbi:hypothetical protein QBC34DRAFT_397504 [Podospora aff. communis PSN243]|uniref:Uncharacterized protein n=1 Tax=Podospora aff. communis PSN243 TaxID=3040156 RepID=A0AAV9H018_9PEZI|nr:hypothetical protein QBC34DRAFT_397504 [Podospora aff. communis PSN243]